MWCMPQRSSLKIVCTHAFDQGLKTFCECATIVRISWQINLDRIKLLSLSAIDCFVSFYYAARVRAFSCIIFPQAFNDLCVFFKGSHAFNKYNKFGRSCTWRDIVWGHIPRVVKKKSVNIFENFANARSQHWNFIRNLSAFRATTYDTIFMVTLKQF